MTGTIALVILGAFVALLGAIALLDVTRGTPVSRVTARRGDTVPAVEDPVFRHLLAASTGMALHAGHEIEVFSCGDETYPRLWDDFRAARTYIVVQMYYAQPGRIADRLHEVLVERARAGVDVLLLLDAFGSSKVGRDWVRSLRDAGIEVVKFRPLRLHRLNAAHHRAHVRAIVIDGVVGWTGGFGFDDKWLGDGRHEGQWRDTNVRFTGPAVSQLLSTFATCWAEETGDLVAGSRFWTPGEHAAAASSAAPHDSPVAGVLHGTPTVGSTAAERLVALSIAGARRRLWITTAYFVADDDFRRLVKQAAARGVDVRILTAGEQSDVKSTLLAARARYEELLKGGVRVYEYRPSMVHAKSIVVDGAWGTAGTMNLDNRSMAFNNECTFMAFDPKFAAELERLFEADLAHSDEIDLATFSRRPWTTKLLEHGAHMLSRML